MPQSQFATLSGYQVSTSHSDKLVGGKLNLVFSNLLEDTARQIISHYEAQLGTFDRFDLSSGVWAGAAGNYFTPAGQKWRYSGPPTVQYVAPGIASVSVSLEAIPA